MRLLSGAVALLACFALSACGEEDDPSADADGTVVFVAHVGSASPGETVQAFAADVAARECRRVLPPVRAFPRDYIQLAGDGRVMVSPGSSRTITVADPVTGSREQLEAPANGITVSPELSAVAWVNGRKIVVQSYVDGSKRVVAEVKGPSAIIGPVLWASSGKWLAYAVRTGGGRDGPPLLARVDVVSIEGGKSRTVHEESGYDSEPIGRFSPDGMTIVMTGSREGLFTVRRDGSGKRVLQRAFVQSQPPPRWSPDGTRIAYAAGYDVWITAVDGSQPSRRLEGLIGGRIPLAWSPDGQWLALAIGRHVTIARSDGSGTERILCGVPPIVEIRGAVWISRVRG